MSDYGHKMTEKQLAALEKRIEKEYKQAAREMKRKAKEYAQRFKEKDKKKKEQVKAGKITQAQYNEWRINQILVGKRWEEMRDTLAADLANTTQITSSMVNGHLPEVYAINHNYGTFMIEEGAHIDTSYTLYDRHTVERLIRDRPDLLPKSKVAIPKELKWNKQKITSAVTQGVLQGESIDGIASRLVEAVGMKEKASIRNARTMVTSAQNAGRIDAFKRAESLGIEMQKIWIATLDGRTRHQHRLLDGQMRHIDDPFEVEKEKIMYPGDPTAAPYMVYNCRCTLGAAVKGTSLEKGIGSTGRITAGGESYEDWQFAKSKEPEKAKLAHQYVDVQYKLSKFPMKVYSGIWLDDVTVADYASKKEKIKAKKEYYEKQIAKAGTYGDTSKVPTWKKYLKDLDEFEKTGEEYLALQSQAQKLKLAIKKLDSPTGGPFADAYYTDEAKRAARRFTSRFEADRFYRPWLDSIWDTLPERQQYAIWEYTHNSHPINKSLAGYHDGWQRWYFVGYENAVWGHEDNYDNRRLRPVFAKFGVGGQPRFFEVVKDLTRAIEQSELPESAWLVRGSDEGGLAGLIADNLSGIQFDDVMRVLSRGDLAGVKAMLEGGVFYNHTFTSTGMATGTGFGGGVSYRIYAPQGTKALYAEPASFYGDTIKMQWELYKVGHPYKNISSEAEIILQRGTGFRITDISRSGGEWVVTMEVVDQPDYFEHFDEDTFTKGATRHKK